MNAVDVFNTISYLEPKCPSCEHKIDYGLTTEWNEKKQAHECKTCHTVLP